MDLGTDTESLEWSSKEESLASHEAFPVACSWPCYKQLGWEGDESQGIMGRKDITQGL